MRIKGFHFLLIILLILCGGQFQGQTITKASKGKIFSILHTNDLHSSLTEFSLALSVC
jgi:2',3'-cyclic-nucleotide 2'-phosphodiesterase (5'-nucleotidase family)